MIQGIQQKLSEKLMKKEKVEDFSFNEALEDPTSISALQRFELMKKLSREEKPESNVILLENMVAVNDIDDELENEIKDEGGKYGIVEKVLVRVNGEEVKIFVRFTAMEGAKKAQKGLNGRFFGGRKVEASFVEIREFEKIISEIS
ncbi:hypothetical protein HK096_001477 [Nowakowskiella sp. JEL0078]|nr:hypothetical protein HK096_001477 [Nowakowskiella sp. JEL0078]